MALNLNSTSSSGISDSMQTYYDRKLLLNAKPNLVHQKYGQMSVLPRQSGKTVQFRKWTPFDALTDPLTEGVVPDGQSLEMTAVTAEIKQYGGYVAVSDLLDLTALDPVINDSVELMGDQGGLTVDTIVRDTVSVAQNVQYAGAKTARHLLKMETGDENKLTVNEIRKAVRTLKKNKAPMFSRGGKGYYVAIVGPDTTYDLQSDSLWQDVSKYQAGEQIFEGEIGKLFGVVFVETTEAKVFAAEDLSCAARNLTVASYNAGTKTVTIDEALTAGDSSALAGRSVIINDTKYTIVSAAAGSAGSAHFVTAEEAGAGAPSDGDSVYPGEAGAGGANVSGTLIFGKNAYGVIDLEGGNLRSIIKPKGSAGTSDPLDQISTIGWKVEGFVSKVLQPLWILRIEHRVSE